jgi:hypothetical protein
MAAIALDMGTGSLSPKIYSGLLVDRRAIVASAAGWSVPPADASKIAVPVTIAPLSTKRHMYQSDIDEIDRALFGSVTVLYEIGG